MEERSNFCVYCTELQSTLYEKEKEIKKLKMHIKKLTNIFLTSKMKNSTKSNFESNFLEENEISEIQDISTSDLINLSCDILDIEKCTFASKSVQTKNTLASKSVQTKIIEIIEISDDLPSNNTESHQSFPAKDEEIEQDYVYDPNYQMYYNSSTGYYYDPRSGLMYDPQNCAYYKYNYDTYVYEMVPYETNTETQNANEMSSCVSEAVLDQVNNLNLDDESVITEHSELMVCKDVSCISPENSSNECEIVDTTVLERKKEIEVPFDSEWQPKEGSKLTVTDMVKQVVNEVNMSDYIYDESKKMYYSPSTGYFYDAIKKLLYDPTSGSYYFYDDSKQTYEFYCQVNPTSSDKEKTEEPKSPEKQKFPNLKNLKKRKKFWKKQALERKRRFQLEQRRRNVMTLTKKKLALKELSRTTEDLSSKDDPFIKRLSEKLCKDSNSSVKSHKNNNEGNSEEFSSPEDGEILSSEDESSAPVCIVRSPVKGSNLSNQNSDFCAPSIRAIVENSDTLQIGSLILITCSGGIMGRDEKNAVYLPDICVSKAHAEIKYNAESQTYSIEDLGSQNGTFINEKRLSEPKEKSEPNELKHGDKLALGSCKLLLHIHEGHETCDNCEPGQVLAEIASNTAQTVVLMTKEEKEKQRREELRRLKKKYGLQGADFQKETVILSEGCEDKAEIRRQTVGSDNPYEKTQETSVDISMSETNKGYQMLKKMGWKEGQTLGTAGSGLLEPIPLCPWTSKGGLGSASLSSVFANCPEDKRVRRWVKAQDRYFQLSSGDNTS